MKFANALLYVTNWSRPQARLDTKSDGSRCHCHGASRSVCWTYSWTLKSSALRPSKSRQTFIRRHGVTSHNSWKQNFLANYETLSDPVLWFEQILVVVSCPSLPSLFKHFLPNLHVTLASVSLTSSKLSESKGHFCSARSSFLQSDCTKRHALI